MIFYNYPIVEMYEGTLEYFAYMFVYSYVSIYLRYEYVVMLFF